MPLAPAKIARGDMELEQWRDAVQCARDAYYEWVAARGDKRDRERAWAVYQAAAEREDAATKAYAEVMMSNGRKAA